MPLVGGEIPFGVVADALRDLVRRDGADTVRRAAPAAAETLGWLVPDLSTGLGSQGGRRAGGRRGTAHRRAGHPTEQRRPTGSSGWCWKTCTGPTPRPWTCWRAWSGSPPPSRSSCCAPRETNRPQTAGRGAGDVEELSRAPHVTRIQLGPLSGPQVAEQITALSRNPVAPGLAPGHPTVPRCPVLHRGARQQRACAGRPAAAPASQN